MNKDWQKYLLSTGGALSEDDSVFFDGDLALSAKDTICDLSGDVVLRVSGEDAETFLQGQFSNDLLALGVPASQLSTWSNPKGRVLTLFRIIRDNEGYLIQMPQALAEQTLKRLKMYVMRAKVNIELQPDLVCIGVSGTKCKTALEKRVENLPVALDETVQSNDLTLCRVRGEIDRFELIARVEAAGKLWDELKSVCQPGSHSVWRLQNIDAGLPVIGVQTSEAFVLQMLNLQHINGVSFKKGCFPGQEVVARMQYLGKLKRRMYRASGVLKDGLNVPLPGADVYNRDVASPVGKIVDAQAVGDGSFRLLLVNAIAAAEKPLFLDAQATQEIELLELPYTIEVA